MTIAAAPIEERWNLADLFDDDDACEAALDAFRERLPELAAFAGSLDRSPARMAEALEAIDEAAERFTLIRAYAMMRSDADTLEDAARRLRQQTDLAATAFTEQISWLRPELLRMSVERIEAAIAAEPRLEAHAFFLRDLARRRPHVRTPAEEELLAQAGLVTRGSNELFDLLNTAELPRPSFTRADGETVRLDPVNFHQVRISPNREERAEAFPLYFGAFESFKETFALNLFQSVKAHLFRARARRHGSCLEAALFDDNVPVAVYENLIAAVREQLLPLLHRYFRLRRRLLGHELAYTDLYCPLGSAGDRRYSTAEARELCIDSMRPLGPEYGEAIRRAFGERWIDWHPSRGKRNGAYANGWPYRAHPYVLINYVGDHDSISTLAHEMGHAMHSYFSNRAQPFATADYSIFVAEVASTLNEALLARLQYERAGSDAERLFLLGAQLDGFRATLFRQTQFAEFELEIHRRVERGESLSGETLNAIYLESLRAYCGHDAGIVEIPECYGVEWASVPHFHYDFYVYQYATGITAAQVLAEGLGEGGDGVERYMSFLRSGGSDYPLELLRRAGVDLESSAPYEAVGRRIESLLDELERAIG